VKHILHKYVAFVRLPHVARLLAVALLARMPIGMVGFAMMMYLRESLGNFALAGAAAGIHFVSMAIAAPIQGRIIDRHGARIPLFATGTVQPLALIGVLLAAHYHLPFATIGACAAVAGAFASPITTLTRTMWRHRFDSEDDRRTAFALDAVAIEINFTVGPAIIAALLATFSAMTAFAFAITVVIFAVTVFIASGVTKLLKQVAGAERHLLGPLTEWRLVLLFVATFGTAMAFGVLEVGYPAYGTALAAPAIAGILLAVNSIGSAVGGALYGGVHFKAPIERQYATILAFMSLPLFLHMAMWPPLPFAVVAFFAGALIAPSITAQSVLVSRFAPAKYATEAFTWSSTFIVSGLGAGMALGGTLVETTGLPSAFLLAGTSAACMSLLVLLALPVGAPVEARAGD